MARIINLPDHGRLIVATDLQGCLRDYYRVVEVFQAARSIYKGDAHLLFTGDLIHGPHLDRDQWPDFLGEFYRDASAEVMEEFMGLSQRYPGRVHALLGNHEHAHVGGPHTAKFALDEVELLESIVGPEGAARLHEIIHTFALVARAPCGAVFTHGAPAAQIKSIRDIETADLSGKQFGSPIDLLDDPVIGKILWARSAEPSAAKKFLKAMEGTFCIFGHDVIPTGFECIGEEQMVVSTSFGVRDAHKVYISLDLGAKYASVRDLRVGHEILPLYPLIAPARLGGRGDTAKVA